MRRISLALVSLAAALALSMPAWASAPARSSRATSFPAIAPDFACTDTMYQRAVSRGITLGISPDSPYTFLDPKTKQPAGIDWAINMALLHWAGIKTVRYQIMPFDSL